MQQRGSLLDCYLWQNSFQHIEVCFNNVSPFKLNTWSRFSRLSEFQVQVSYHGKVCGRVLLRSTLWALFSYSGIVLNLQQYWLHMPMKWQ